ncbi:hypothetical protein EX30DRAFT_160608 [Ascodesmis nigricans]|uniref:Uncharacterized protein n=1 Tax=Ascodesmis nigricans TaxID=341454 RepID=A0A4V3SI20_9PEZI|nr:hypothetical protein EX30DRAFT_160608 [Ascodesmis nigricans]
MRMERVETMEQAAGEPGGRCGDDGGRCGDDGGGARVWRRRREKKTREQEEVSPSLSLAQCSSSSPHHTCTLASSLPLLHQPSFTSSPSPSPSLPPSPPHTAPRHRPPAIQSGLLKFCVSHPRASSCRTSATQLRRLPPTHLQRPCYQRLLPTTDHHRDRT